MTLVNSAYTNYESRWFKVTERYGLQSSEAGLDFDLSALADDFRTFLSAGERGDGQIFIGCSRP